MLRGEGTRILGNNYGSWIQWLMLFGSQGHVGSSHLLVLGAEKGFGC